MLAIPHLSQVSSMAEIVSKEAQKKSKAGICFRSPHTTSTLEHQSDMKIIHNEDGNPFKANIKQALAGNPVKEILLKLNLPDHRSILTDLKEYIKMDMEVPGSSRLTRFIATCSYSTDIYKDIMKAQLKNIKKDGYTRFQYQEQYEHVGPEVTRSQEGKRSQDHDKRLCLDVSYVVELADGRISETNTVHRGCTLGLLVIVCDEKIVRIPYRDKVLIVQVTKKETEDKSEEKRLEDVPTVQDFPEVFPEVLPGLPPTRQVEF
ncbi:hypothetical protein Tco_0114927 [Tanacetum coccineum]